MTATQDGSSEDVVFLFNRFGQLGYMAEIEEGCVPENNWWILADSVDILKEFDVFSPRMKKFGFDCGNFSTPL